MDMCTNCVRYGGVGLIIGHAHQCNVLMRAKDKQ